MPQIQLSQKADYSYDALLSNPQGFQCVFVGWGGGRGRWGLTHMHTVCTRRSVLTTMSCTVAGEHGVEQLCASLWGTHSGVIIILGYFIIDF